SRLSRRSAAANVLGKTTWIRFALPYTPGCKAEMLNPRGRCQGEQQSAVSGKHIFRATAVQRINNYLCAFAPGAAFGGLLRHTGGTRQPRLQLAREALNLAQLGSSLGR